VLKFHRFLFVEKRKSVRVELKLFKNNHLRRGTARRAPTASRVKDLVIDLSTRLEKVIKSYSYNHIMSTIQRINRSLDNKI